MCARMLPQCALLTARGHCIFAEASQLVVGADLGRKDLEFADGPLGLKLDGGCFCA